MGRDGLDVLLLSTGPELPWLTGYEAMPLERLTMLVVPRDGDATMVVPRLEAPRVRDQGDLFRILAWDETEDPVAIVAGLCGSAPTVAIGDRTWARFLVDLQAALDSTAFSRAAPVVGPLRAVKDGAEIRALQAAAAAADRVAAQLQAGQIPLVGRSEAEISADIGRRLIDEGHRRVNFAIVAAGANAASPHHEPGPTRVEPGQVVLCDFGGTMASQGDGVGYCSDITRCVVTGPVPDEVAEAYQVLQAAQAASVASVSVGTPCEEVDRIGRDLISAGGYGSHFIHRTGHGIGVEEHEDPYIVAGNGTLLEVGHVFSIEPGIYLTGRFGLRLEDIVVATADGVDSLNRADHDLVVVEA